MLTDNARQLCRSVANEESVVYPQLIALRWAARIHSEH